MTQLVNSSCGVCGERISSIIEGRFCEECGGAVHSGYARAPATPAPGKYARLAAPT
jgi:hypothetical protein